MGFSTLKSIELVVYAHTSSMSWWDLRTSKTSTRILYIFSPTDFAYRDPLHDGSCIPLRLVYTFVDFFKLTFYSTSSIVTSKFNNIQEFILLDIHQHRYCLFDINDNTEVQ